MSFEHKDALISVVVPVYEVENYLKKCVDSIIAQTFEHLEIILVDDGSSDKCPEMCDKYAIEDKRIRVIHKQNGGLSDARNVGIDAATGQYIMFVDSDDYIDRGMVAELHKSLVENRCDIATCKYIIVTESSVRSITPLSNASSIYIGEDALEQMLLQKNLTHSAWGKLYDIKLFEHIRYPVGYNYEDLGTTYKLFSKSSKVVINSFIGYRYLLRNNSIMSSHFNEAKMDILNFAQQQLKYVTEYHPRIIRAAEYRLFVEAVVTLGALFDSGLKFDEIELECITVIRKYRWRVLRNSGSNYKAAVYAVLSILNIRTLIILQTTRSKFLRHVA